MIVIACCLGLVNSVDNPARQSFVPEIVGKDLVSNAVSLNSAMVNAARAVGPATAGVLIVTVGVAACFLLNTVSFIAVIIALATMQQELLRPAITSVNAPGQLLEGLRYVRRTPRLLTPLLMMALIGALSYEFQVVLPVLAKNTFHGQADAYGFFTAAMGIGAVIGGLAVASRAAKGMRSLALAAGTFGLTMLVAAVAPTLATEVLALAVVGAGSVAFPREHHAAADRRPEHARAGHGLVGRRLPGYDTDRWPHRGLRLSARQPTLGVGAWRAGRADRDRLGGLSAPAPGLEPEPGHCTPPGTVRVAAALTVPHG